MVQQACKDILMCIKPLSGSLGILLMEYESTIGDGQV